MKREPGKVQQNNQFTLSKAGTLLLKVRLHQSAFFLFLRVHMKKYIVIE